jgi:hypothetical protein
MVRFFKTPQARLELATNRLTADRSTTELLRIAAVIILAKRRGIWQVHFEVFCLGTSVPLRLSGASGQKYL